MTNNVNPLQPARVVKTVSPGDGEKYDIISLARNTDTDKKIRLTQNYIAIVPFERNEEDKIAYVYAVKFSNYATDSSDVTLIIDSIDSERDTTAYDAIGRTLLEEAGLNMEEVGLSEDDVFYLGPMTLSDPIIAKFRCYAVDLTKISRPDKPFEFTTNLSKYPFTRGESEIVKLGFHQIVNGDYSDATILAGSFLLVSYFQ